MFIFTKYFVFFHSLDSIVNHRSLLQQNGPGNETMKLWIQIMFATSMDKTFHREITQYAISFNFFFAFSQFVLEPMLDELSHIIWYVVGHCYSCYALYFDIITASTYFCIILFDYDADFQQYFHLHFFSTSFPTVYLLFALW